LGRNITVTVRNTKGIRYGEFDINGIKGKFPIQAITSTNLGHARVFKQSNFDFKTQFLEILESYPERIFKDPLYRRTRISEISKMIQQNHDKICSLVLNRSKETPITRMQNRILIRFQISCGFKLIKAFFMDETNALRNSREYRSMIPSGSSLVLVLDENLENSVFKDLYFDAYKKYKDKVIGFLGREPSKKNEDNKLNFIFLRKRKNDRVIRLVSFTRKSMKGVVSSLIYHLQGLDVFSFATRLGNQNIPSMELLVLKDFSFVPLTKGSGFTCVVTRTSLYSSVQRFNAIKKSSVPVSVHNIVRLNEEFAKIHQKYTRQKLAAIARVFLV